MATNFKTIISESKMKNAGVRTRDSSGNLTVTAPYEYSFALNYPYNSRINIPFASDYLKDASGNYSYTSEMGIDPVGLPTGFFANISRTLADSTVLDGMHQLYLYPSFSNHQLGTYQTITTKYEKIETQTSTFFKNQENITMGGSSNSSEGGMLPDIAYSLDDSGCWCMGLNDKVLHTLSIGWAYWIDYYPDAWVTTSSLTQDVTRGFLGDLTSNTFWKTQKTATLDFSELIANWKELQQPTITNISFKIIPYTFTITQLAITDSMRGDLCMKNWSSMYNANRIWRIVNSQGTIISTPSTITISSNNDFNQKMSAYCGYPALPNAARFEGPIKCLWSNNTCILNTPYWVWTNSTAHEYFGVLGYMIYDVNITYSYMNSSSTTTTTNIKYKDAADYIHTNFKKHQLVQNFNLYEEPSRPYDSSLGTGYSIWCDGSGPITIRDNSTQPHIPALLGSYSITSSGVNYTTIGKISRDNSSYYDGYNLSGLKFIPYYGLGTNIGDSVKSWYLDRTNSYSAEDINALVRTSSSTITPLKNNCLSFTEVSVPFSIYAGKGASSSTKIADYTIKLPQINSVVAQAGPYNIYSKVCWFNHARGISAVTATLLHPNRTDFTVNCSMKGSLNKSYTIIYGSNTDISVDNDSYFCFNSLSSTAGSDVYRESDTGTGTIRLYITPKDSTGNHSRANLTVDIPISASYYHHISAYPVALFYNNSQGVTWSSIQFNTNTNSLTSANTSTSTSSINNTSYTFVKGTSVSSCSAHRGYISTSDSNYYKYYYRSKIVYNIGNGSDSTLQTGSYTYYSPDSGETISLSSSSISVISRKIGQSTSNGLNLLFCLDKGTFQPPTVQSCSDAGSWKRSCRVYNPNPVSLTMKYSSNKTKNKYSCNSSTATTTISAHGTTTVTIQDQSGYDDEWILFAFNCSGRYCYRTIDEDVSSSPNTVATGWSTSV